MTRNRAAYLTRRLSAVLTRVLRAARPKYGYFGDFDTWSAALTAADGYDAEPILARVTAATENVRSGEAAYERDSVIFDEVQYSWPLLAALLWIASRQQNRLDVLDLDGSLGSTYRQNRAFLDHLDQIRWSIVEQRSFAERGRERFEDETLRFYESIEACVAERSPDTLLLCGVLPYLEKPYDVLGEVISEEFSHVVVDRTPFVTGEVDRLTVQKVPPYIYDASYPAWFLSEAKFLEFMTRDFQQVAEFPALAGRIRLRGAVAEEKGFIFRR